MSASEPEANAPHLRVVPELQEQSDEELMCLVRDGMDEAFDLLVERHKRGVFRFLVQMTRNEASAEELLSESFLKLYQARERYQITARFSTYLYTIARRAALNAQARMHVRSEAGTETEKELDSARSPLTEYQPMHQNPEKAAMVRRQLQALRDELARLRPGHREAFLLYYGEGLNCSEVADILAISPAEAKGRLAYTRKLLRERLGPRT